MEFLVCNTDAQALAGSQCPQRLQLGRNITQGLGAGSRPDIGRAAAEEAIDADRPTSKAATWCSSPPAWAAAPAPARPR